MKKVKLPKTYNEKKCKCRICAVGENKKYISNCVWMSSSDKEYVNKTHRKRTCIEWKIYQLCGIRREKMDTHTPERIIGR